MAEKANKKKVGLFKVDKIEKKNNRSDSFNKLIKDIRTCPVMNDFNFHHFNVLAEKIKEGGDFNTPIDRIVHDNDDKKKIFMKFCMQSDEHKLAFLALPKFSYIFFRDLAGLYDNNLAFCFFHCGAIFDFYENKGTKFEKLYYYKLFVGRKMPLTTRLMLSLWDPEVEIGYYQIFMVINSANERVSPKSAFFDDINSTRIEFSTKKEKELEKQRLDKEKAKKEIELKELKKKENKRKFKR